MTQNNKRAKVVAKYKNNIEEQTMKLNKGKNIETKVWRKPTTK
jgi:hypothetical protein